MIINCKVAMLTDVRKVLEFMKENYKDEKIAFVRHKAKRTIEHLLLNSALGQLLLIEVDGLTVGYLCLAYGYTLENHGRDCFLDEIYIEPAFQGKGIGTKVIKIIQPNLRKEGFKALHLIVSDSNRKAYNYYIKNGFTSPKASFMTKALMKRS
jgi:ribosomal protein S18 acetylase RimI-like enzyme